MKLHDEIILLLAEYAKPMKITGWFMVLTPTVWDILWTKGLIGFVEIAVCWKGVACMWTGALLIWIGGMCRKRLGG